MSKTEIHIVFQVLNFLHSDHHLAVITSPAEHLVLINLASHKGKKGICPSISLIAKELKLEKRTIIRSIQRWEELEIVQTQKNIGKNNSYFLFIPLPTSDIEDTSSMNVTSDIHATRLVTFTTSTSDIHDTIKNKEVTKEVTNKSFYEKGQKVNNVSTRAFLNRFEEKKVENAKRHEFADSMDKNASEKHHVAQHEKLKEKEMESRQQSTSSQSAANTFWGPGHPGWESQHGKTIIRPENDNQSGSANMPSAKDYLFRKH